MRNCLNKFFFFVDLVAWIAQVIPEKNDNNQKLCCPHSLFNLELIADKIKNVTFLPLVVGSPKPPIIFGMAQIDKYIHKQKSKPKILFYSIQTYILHTRIELFLFLCTYYYLIHSMKQKRTRSALTSNSSQIIILCLLFLFFSSMLCSNVFIASVRLLLFDVVCFVVCFVVC